MLKKYILALSILGLVAPASTLGVPFGNKLTTAAHYAGSLLKSRLAWGLLTGFYTKSCIDNKHYYDDLLCQTLPRDQNYQRYINKMESSRNLADAGLIPIVVLIALDIKNLFSPGNRMPKGTLSFVAGALAKHMYNKIHEWRNSRNSRVVDAETADSVLGGMQGNDE